MVVLIVCPFSILWMIIFRCFLGVSPVIILRESGSIVFWGLKDLHASVFEAIFWREGC